MNSTTTQGEAKTTETAHVHDHGISVGAGDIPAEKIAALRAFLVIELDRISAEAVTMFDLPQYSVGTTVTYDGTRECDVNHR